MAVAALSLCLVLSMASTEKLSDAELVAQAEVAFRSGLEVRDNPLAARPLFRKAALGYDELRRRGAHNVDLYRNQGNCYLLAGDLPEAILCYRRGLRLAPADSLLRANLAHVRAQVVYPRSGELGGPPTDYWPSWLPSFAPRTGLLLFVGGYSLGWIGLVRWWMAGRSAPLVMAILAFGQAMILASGLALEAWNEHVESVHPPVVIARDGVPLRKGNGVLYPPRFDSPLNRGVEARLQFERGPWLRIELASGATGWVPRTAVLVAAP